MRRILFLSFVSFCLILMACASETNSESINTVTSNYDYQRIEFSDIKATSVEKEACETVGGIVRLAGRIGAEHCIQNLPDAGNTCHDASDCLGRCILNSPDAHRAEAGTNSTGVCESTDEHFGCTTLVNHGEVEGTLCVD